MKSKWDWKMAYCRDNGLLPTDNASWQFAEDAYQEQLKAKDVSYIEENSIRLTDGRLVQAHEFVVLERRFKDAMIGIGNELDRRHKLQDEFDEIKRLLYISTAALWLSLVVILLQMGDYL